MIMKPFLICRAVWQTSKELESMLSDAEISFQNIESEANDQIYKHIGKHAIMIIRKKRARRVQRERETSPGILEVGICKHIKG